MSSQDKHSSSYINIQSDSTSPIQPALSSSKLSTRFFKKTIDDVSLGLQHSRILEKEPIESKKSSRIYHACQMLGIKPEELIKKNYSDIRDVNHNEEENKAIYQHYLKKYENMVKLVTEKVKEISAAEARRFTPRYQKKSPEISDIEKTKPKKFRSISTSVKRLSGLEPEIVLNELMEKHKPRINELMKKWETIHNQCKVSTQFNMQDYMDDIMEKEQQKMNKKCIQNSKVIQNSVDFETKRNEILLDLCEKERQKQQKRKIFLEKAQKAIETRQKSFREKLLKVKKVEEDYMHKLKADEKKLRKRYFALEEHLSQKEEKRKEEQGKKEKLDIERLKRIKEMKERDWENVYEQFMLNNSQSQLNLPHRKSTNSLIISRSCSQNQIRRSSEIFLEEAKKKKEDELKNRESKIIDSILQKEYEVDHFRKLIQKKILQKRQKNKVMEQYKKELLAEIECARNKYQNSIMEKLSHIDEHIKEQNEARQKASKLKHLERELKFKDQKENLARKEKIQDIQTETILKNELFHSLKIDLLREQNDLIQTMKHELNQKINQHQKDVDNALRQSRLKGKDFPFLDRNKSRNHGSLIRHGSGDQDDKSHVE